jgi:hypothetical protein
MQVSAAEFIAVIIALATGCVVALGIAWRCYRELRECQSLLDKTVKDLELASAELAALNVVANRMKAAQSDGFNNPIDYGPSRYIA